MIHLLYTVIFAEMALVMILLFKTPLRKIVIATLDRVKRGRGPVMVKTVAGTVFVVLLSSLYSIIEIQNRAIEAGSPNPTDQFALLESSSVDDDLENLKKEISGSKKRGELPPGRTIVSSGIRDPEIEMELNELRQKRREY